MSTISGDSPSHRRLPVDQFEVDEAEHTEPLAPATGTIKALVDVLAEVGCAGAAKGANKLAAKSGCGKAVPVIAACVTPATQAVKTVAHRAIDASKGN